MRAYMFEDPRVELERAREMAARALNAERQSRGRTGRDGSRHRLDGPRLAGRRFLQALAVAQTSARVHELHGLITLLRATLAE